MTVHRRIKWSRPPLTAKGGPSTIIYWPQRECFWKCSCLNIETYHDSLQAFLHRCSSKWLFEGTLILGKTDDLFVSFIKVASNSFWRYRITFDGIHPSSRSKSCDEATFNTPMSLWRKKHALNSSCPWECQCFLREISKNPITRNKFSALICWLKVGNVRRLELSTMSRIPIWRSKMIFQDLIFASKAIDYIKKYLGAPTGRDLFKIFKTPKIWHIQA